MLQVCSELRGNLWGKNEIRFPGKAFCLLTPVVKRHLANVSRRANRALAPLSRTKRRTLVEEDTQDTYSPLREQTLRLDLIQNCQIVKCQTYFPMFRRGRWVRHVGTLVSERPPMLHSGAQRTYRFSPLQVCTK